MSEYAREEILKLIEEKGGPEGLDLSGKDLSGIDLSRKKIAVELEKARKKTPGETPVWYKWTGGINLEGANLQKADLRSVKLQGADLYLANLQEAILWGANLREADVAGANLRGASLEAAKLQRAFLGGADLQGAHLRGADLRGAILYLANLQEADLRGAKLQGALLREADLRGANLQGAKLQNANLLVAKLQKANLGNAKLQGANLRLSNLQGSDLGAADFQGATLVSAKLQGASVRCANLEGALLSYSHLEKVDLFGAKSLEGAYFYNAFLDDTRMRREQLGKAIGEELEGRYDKAKEAYLALKNNFAEIGRYRDESWAYVKERQMGKKMNHPRLARKFYGEELPENPDAWRLWRFYLRHTAKWALHRIEEWACGYGESIPKTLRAMGVALVGFAILYRLLGAVVDANGNPSSSCLHCLLYSGGAFTTFGVDTLRPANDWIRALSIFESVVGIALTGLLGFVLGNRIRRS